MNILRRNFFILGLAATFTVVLPAEPPELPPNRSPVFPRERTKSGAWLLNAFSALTKATQDSVVRLDVDGRKAALGTVVDTEGLVLTKASELSDGELTCRLAGGQRVAAHVLSIDEQSDVALVQVESTRLKPVQWASMGVTVGEWAITPGIDSTPEAVGIVSAEPRKILPKRALIGVVLDFEAEQARIAQVSPGMSAEKAGLQPGDTILSVNGDAVSTSESLRNTLGGFREGQSVKLLVRRDGEPFEVSVVMEIPKPGRLGSGFDRADRMNHLGGELSRRAEGFDLAIQHDTVLQPWQCGGPLLNLEGKAIGLNIARAGRIASYALPSRLVAQLIERLKRQQQMPVQERPSS